MLNKKQIISLLLALMMILSLSACGTTEKKVDEKKETTEKSEARKNI